MLLLKEYFILQMEDEPTCVVEWECELRDKWIITVGYNAYIDVLNISQHNHSFRVLD